MSDDQLEEMWRLLQHRGARLRLAKAMGQLRRAGEDGAWAVQNQQVEALTRAIHLAMRGLASVLDAITERREGDADD